MTFSILHRCVSFLGWGCSSFRVSKAFLELFILMPASTSHFKQPVLNLSKLSVYSAFTDFTSVGVLDHYWQRCVCSHQYGAVLSIIWPKNVA